MYQTAVQILHELYNFTIKVQSIVLVYGYVPAQRKDWRRGVGAQSGLPLYDNWRPRRARRRSPGRKDARDEFAEARSGCRLASATPADTCHAHAHSRRRCAPARKGTKSKYEYVVCIFYKRGEVQK